jgi:hypothetical protein
VDTVRLRLRTRLIPAILAALGVVLLATGLLSYTTAIEGPPEVRALASYDPLPTLNGIITLPGGREEATTNPSFPPGRVATRIVIKRLDIDLPVMLQTDDYGTYPLCDVALYLPYLGQPGEGVATYLYAHARVGMFLPLLRRSERADNGQSLVGMAVEVYTSDDWRFVYTISEIRRHVRDLDAAIAATTEQLWLQTSEGPNGTVPKLQVVADFVSAEETDHASAHPTAHPRICR